MERGLRRWWLIFDVENDTVVATIGARTDGVECRTEEEARDTAPSGRSVARARSFARTNGQHHSRHAHAVLTAKFMSLAATTSVL